RFRAERVNLLAAVRRTSRGNLQFLGPELDRVQNPASGAAQKDLLPTRIQAETKRALGKEGEAARGDARAVRDDVLVGLRIIGEGAAGEVHWLRRVVVKLDIIPGERRGVGQELIDHDVALRGGGVAVVTPRRAAHLIAR